jgi:outer membrane usher protein
LGARWIRWCLAGAALAISLARPPAAIADDEGIARVILNGDDGGDRRFVRAGDDVLLSADDLRAIGFDVLPKGYEDATESLVPLSAFEPPPTWEYDGDRSILRITADPRLLPRTTVDLTYKPTYALVTPFSPSAFLNWGAAYRADGDVAKGLLTATAELVLSAGGWVALADGIYRRRGDADSGARGMTSLTHDDPAQNQRLVIGDTYGISATTGSGLALGGVSLSTNLAMSPLLVRTPTFDFSGFVSTASDVELFVNNVSVKKEHFDPGGFTFENVSNIAGAADVTLVAKDAFGRETRTTSSVYGASLLLHPDLQEYSYALGFRRLKLGIDSFEYGPPAFLAYHRAGLTPWLTAGFRIEADRALVNGGPLLTFKVGNLGEVDAALAASRAAGETGWGAVASYLFAGSRFSFRVSGRAFSKEFVRLSPFTLKPRVEGTVSVGVRTNWLGTLSVQDTEWDRWEGGRGRRSAAFYTLQLGRYLALTATGTRTEEPLGKPVWDATAGLLVTLWGDAFGSVRHGVNGGTQTTTATLQQSPPPGPGLGYRLAAETTEASDGKRRYRGGALVDYHAPWFNASVEYTRAEANAYAAGVAGALVVTDRSFHLTRPIRDAFAMVRVEGLGDVGVKLNGQEMGKTGSDGSLIVPSLVSYAHNRLTIDDKDIPVEYALQSFSRYFAIPYRSGGVVRFAATKVQASVGRIVVVQDGKREPAELWGLELTTPAGKTEAIVGKRGEFYLENVPAGSHPARVFTQGRECRFELDIPESAEMMIDLGEVICEIH